MLAQLQVKKGEENSSAMTKLKKKVIFSIITHNFILSFPLLLLRLLFHSFADNENYDLSFVIQIKILNQNSISSVGLFKTQQKLMSLQTHKMILRRKRNACYTNGSQSFQKIVLCFISL